MLTLISCAYMYLNRITSSAPVNVRILDRLSINNGFCVVLLLFLIIGVIFIDNTFIRTFMVLDIVFLSYFFLNYLRFKIELVSLDYIKPKVFNYLFIGCLHIILLYSYFILFI